MPELISLHQIVTRKGKGEPRIVIKPGSRFDTADYPMISDKEWKAMMQGEHPIVRTPDDPAFVVPAQSRAAAAAEVVEGRSPRSDLASQAARVAEREEDEGEGEEAGDGEDGDEPVPARARRRKRRSAASDDDEV